MNIWNLAFRQDKWEKIAANDVEEFDCRKNQQSIRIPVCSSRRSDSQLKLQTLSTLHQ
jgi:hypothetical protein